MVLSDIVGDPLSFIASGPTVPNDEKCTCQDAWNIISTYNIQHQLPPNVIAMIQQGLDSEEENDAPTVSHSIFTQHIRNGNHDNPKLAETILVGNNEKAVLSCAQKAKSLGYYTVILGTTIEGEAKDVAGVYTAMARQSQCHENTTYGITPKLPAAFIAGGETTVSLPANHDLEKRGGRNQELGLVAACNLSKMKLRNVVVASVGTDGTDGPTDAAGAIVDGRTIARIEQRNGGKVLGDVAIREHDAYTFLGSEHHDGDEDEDYVSALVRTGPTGTNVADIAVILVAQNDIGTKR
eukprot:CAMPEP_0195523786 /NCGR_PEP_ID=MMETSP0794_2-20130614/23205_1 /TAXON_ID=515487 /ORGANISM="Stephanopyxis turris, Strain CCMP 815" /LENGTH=294 /DNA_ID=CAMNT_0040653857 /DNA_START=98 /DNA_END=983 /DNA_ORIENTATION=-